MSERHSVSGFAVLAQTGEMRRKLQRVEELALQLEQAVNDLNACHVGVKIGQSK